jgi:hypothetical protein
LVLGIAPLLYRLSDGRFQIIEQGRLAPLMVGFEYVLVETAFAEFVEDLDMPRLKIIDAAIYDPQRNEEIRTHKELLIRQRFSSDMIRDIDLDGDRFLLMNGTYLFVSPSLKERLEASPFKYLRFTEGLDGFAAKDA